MKNLKYLIICIALASAGAYGQTATTNTHLTTGYGDMKTKEEILSPLQTALNTAQIAKLNAQTAYNNAQTAYNNAQTALNNAQTALKNAPILDRAKCAMPVDKNTAVAGYFYRDNFNKCCLDLHQLTTALRDNDQIKCKN